VVFSGVTIDSRQCSQGSLFVALQGEKQDGHEYIHAALRQGCRGALARSDRTPSAARSVPGHVYEWDGRGWKHSGDGQTPAILVLVPDSLEALQKLGALQRSRFTPTVVAITGSVGKSSTKELVAAVLAIKFDVLKSPKSYNNEIGLPLTLLELGAEHEVVILEMGTYGPGEITLLTEIAHPHIGIVTNVSHSHLERMGTLETIAQAKAELPAALPPNGLAVLNGDEALIRHMAAVTKAAVWFYGQSEGCDLRASEVRSHGLEGISFRIEPNGERRRLRSCLPGRHSVYAALAAASVGRHLGMAWDEIEAGLLDPSAQLRLLHVPGLRGATLLDDTYNASPVSCRAALELLSGLPGRKIAVLGDMLELGSLEEQGHRQVGEWAAEVVQLLYLLGKRARWIGQAALARGMPPGRVHFCDSRDEVVTQLKEVLGRQDTVLVKGSRGLEMEHIIAALQEQQEGTTRG
jgi:UDP-N-acetylmuramoyl-tripeptide--D-alanyl-D-alanine ligase